MPEIEVGPNMDESIVLRCSLEHENRCTLSSGLRKENQWDQCPRCGAFDAYLQKDVPKKLFLITLVLFLALALYLLSIDWFLGIGLLFALALLDLVLYRTLPDVLVCYGCHSEARGATQEEHFSAFDHHIAEGHRQKSLKIL